MILALRLVSQTAPGRLREHEQPPVARDTR